MAALAIAGIAVLLFFVMTQSASGDSAVAIGCSEMVYSFSQLVGLAESAGFGCDAQTAAAIALAESSGQSDAVGDKCLAPTNGPAIGLWQINTGKHKTYTAAQLTNPATNAQEAYAIYLNAGGFSPWTTYNNGAYAKFMPGIGCCNECVQGC